MLIQQGNEKFWIQTEFFLTTVGILNGDGNYVEQK